ncbi:MAG: response regulator transcription factor [Bacteroidetes bacterium]|nr:response regulator transcription factor [Bacteroidota bacterium]
MKPVNIAIIEDNLILREGLKVLFDPLPEFHVVATLGNRGNLLQEIRKRMPDVVLLDIGLHSQNSLLFVKALQREECACKVIVMDILPTQDDIYAYVQAGVSGFIMKDAPVKELLSAIREVAKGSQVLPHQLTDSLFTQIVNHSVANHHAQLLQRAVRMTRREREVIMLVADGLTNKEIARELNLSPYTVKSHIHNILEKLSLRTRVQIASLVQKAPPLSQAQPPADASSGRFTGPKN